MKKQKIKCPDCEQVICSERERCEPPKQPEWEDELENLIIIECQDCLLPQNEIKCQMDNIIRFIRHLRQIWEKETQEIKKGETKRIWYQSGYNEGASQAKKEVIREIEKWAEKLSQKGLTENEYDILMNLGELLAKLKEIK
jgi:hypothetical protein